MGSGSKRKYFKIPKNSPVIYSLDFLSFISYNPVLYCGSETSDAGAPERDNSQRKKDKTREDFFDYAKEN